MLLVRSRSSSFAPMLPLGHFVLVSFFISDVYLVPTKLRLMGHGQEDIRVGRSLNGRRTETN